MDIVFTMTRRVDWAKIKMAYITNHRTTLTSLAKRHKLHVKTVEQRAKKGKWQEERAAIQERADALTGQLVVMDIAKFQAAKFQAGMDLAELGMEQLSKLERWGAVGAKMVTELGWKLGTEALGLDDKTTINNYNAMVQNNMMSIKDLVTAMRQEEQGNGQGQ